MKTTDIILNILNEHQMVSDMKATISRTFFSSVNASLTASLASSLSASLASSLSASLASSLAASASTLVAAFCLFCIAGCSSDPMDPFELQLGEKVQMTMHTSGPQTRADYEGDGDVPSSSGDKMHFSWRSGDLLSVYVVGVVGNGNCKLETKEKGKRAPFNGAVTPWDGTQKTIYAFYPYSASGYSVAEPYKSATASTSLTLPNPQTYKVGGAVSNSFMVGVGQAVAEGKAIDASVYLKQVMSIIKLNIVNAPAKVTWVQLKCSEAVFPTKATVKLSDATISNPTAKVGYLAVAVNDGTTVKDKSVSVAMFPADLTGKTINIEVSFEGGQIKSINKPGLFFERNTHYVIDFDASGLTVPEYYEINGLKWASGNLVADGDHGAKIGAPTDNGLYFQFGSLVGWSGGINGKGTGRIVTDERSLASSVTPLNSKTNLNWNYYSKGDATKDDPANLIGDPCRFYLKGDWRLPTKDEFKMLFQNSGYPSFGPWKSQGNFSSNSINSYAVHVSGLRFPLVGSRQWVNSFLYNFGKEGKYWSSTFDNLNNIAYSLSILGTGSINPVNSDYGSRASAYTIRCVRK